MERRWLAIMFACACALLGCGRVVFDHRGGSPARDGGPGDLDECTGAADGTRCDDRDVCTPSSSCRDERCIPGNAFESCDVADSAADFGTVQGGSDWYYGYWNASTDPDGSYDPDTDFDEMESCDAEAWRPPGLCEMDRNDPGYRWTSNLAWSLQHPEHQPDLELPVRRWISDVSGPARILADHHVGGAASDGTRALLLVDGVEVWRNDVEGGSEDGVQASIDVELREGTVVEQLVHPVDVSADDTTYFSIVIQGR